MTALQRLLLLLSLIALANFQTSAQVKRNLPEGLNENSSLSEIVQWLDRSSFGNARIVLNDTWDDLTYRSPLVDDEPAKNSFVFAQGFKVTNLEGCTIALGNNDPKTVLKSMELESRDRQVAQLNLEPHRMSPSKGRSTYRFTKDPEKSRVLGPWRTEFKHKGWSYKSFLGLYLYSADTRKLEARWIGYNLAFTFDNKEMSENFDAAFRQAIRLCRSK